MVANLPYNVGTPIVLDALRRGGYLLVDVRRETDYEPEAPADLSDGPPGRSSPGR